jgi:hypothetical protein
MPHAIGPAGIVARVAVGITLIALALFWWTPTTRRCIGMSACGPGTIRGHLNATAPAGYLGNAMVVAPLSTERWLA